LKEVVEVYCIKQVAQKARKMAKTKIRKKAKKQRFTEEKEKRM